MRSKVNIKAFILSGADGLRNTSLLRDLDKLDIKVELVPYVDTAIAKSHLLKNSRKASKFMSDGEMACAFGHFEIYKRILSEEGENFLIFEDDADLVLEELQYLREIKSRIPNHIFLLGACGGLVLRRSFELGLKRFYPLIGSAMVGSHAYMINKETARDLYENTKYLQIPADGFARSKAVKVFVQYPFGAKQLMVKSSIPRSDYNQERESVFLIGLLKLLWRDSLDLARTGRLGVRILEKTATRTPIRSLVFKLPGCRD